MAVVLLGNKSALHPDGSAAEGEQVTTIHIPDDDPHRERTRNIVHADGIWASVSAAHPTWVASDDPDLEEYLARHFGCPVKGMDDANQELENAAVEAEAERLKAHPPESE